jgi:hypothetical protein
MKPTRTKEACRLIEYAALLGYQLSENDCRAIIDTRRESETIEEAVNDFLDAFER